MNVRMQENLPTSSFDEVETPLITIVVPVYNVESYLEACLHSLIHQTYSNIELILVDDGSTDSSRNICDLFASRYAQVFVFHKENGGLSSARNYGAQVARGQYLTFVDSDDIVSLDYVEILYKAIATTHAGIAITSFLSLSSQESFVDRTTPHANTETITAISALRRLLLLKGVNESACGKLALTKTWLSHPFPLSKVYEDLSIMLQVIDSSETVAIIDTPMYGQVCRPGSITRSGRICASQFLDFRDAMNSCCDYVRTRYSTQLSCELESFRTLLCVRFYRLSRDVEVHNEESMAAAVETREEIKASLWRTLIGTTVPTSTKLKALLITISPKIYDLLYKAFQFQKNRLVR